MTSRRITLFVFCFIPLLSLAQVSINDDNSNADPSSILDVKSTDKGLLMPRMTTAERDAILNPAQGLTIFNVQDSCFNYYTGIKWVKDCGRDFSLDEFPIPANQFGSSGNDRGESVAVDAAGNAYVTGEFENTLSFGSTNLISAGSNDIFVTKYKPNGEALWAIQFGGSNFDDAGGISVDAAGNSYVTGSFRGMASFGSFNLTASSSFDVFVAKIDPTGQVLWVVSFGGSGNSQSTGIDLDLAGNIYVSGHFSGAISFDGNTLTSAVGDDEGFIVKLDANGQASWAVQLGGPDNALPAGSIEELAADVSIDAAGNSYVTGYFAGTASFGGMMLTAAGRIDMFVVKIDASGNVVWARNGGGTSFDMGLGVDTDASGNVYVKGYFVTSASIGGINLTAVSPTTIDGFLAKYSPSGQILWAISFGHSGVSDGDGIDVDDSGNIYIAGGFFDTGSYGGINLSSTGDSDIYVAKLDANGQFVWAVQAGGAGSFYDDANSISLGMNGRLYITGLFEGTSTFGTTSLSSSGDFDVFLWILDSGAGNTGIITNSNLAASQDQDSDPTNEIQNLNDLLSTGNDGGAAQIKNIADPTDAQDAATKSYVDGVLNPITGQTFKAQQSKIEALESTVKELKSENQLLLKEIQALKTLINRELQQRNKPENSKPTKQQ